MQEVDPASASGAAIGVEDVIMARDDAEEQPSNLRGAGLHTSDGLTCGNLGEFCVTSCCGWNHCNNSRCCYYGYLWLFETLHCS